mgnify:CR=1 FL=1
MAKKKKKAAKTKTKAKARKKLSVKKRPVKDLDASKAKGAKGGLAFPGTDANVKFGPSAVIKLGGSAASDKISPGALYQKIQ